MKYEVMQPIVVVSDTLKYDLPIGEAGFVLVVNRSISHGLQYNIRVPSKKDGWWVPECDIMDAEEWATQGANHQINQSLMNFALETKNRELFDRLHRK